MIQPLLTQSTDDARTYRLHDPHMLLEVEWVSYSTTSTKGCFLDTPGFAWLAGGAGPSSTVASYIARIHNETRQNTLE
jgi:hypothetical protein